MTPLTMNIVTGRLMAIRGMLMGVSSWKAGRGGGPASLRGGTRATGTARTATGAGDDHRVAVAEGGCAGRDHPRLVAQAGEHLDACAVLEPGLDGHEVGLLGRARAGAVLHLE